MGLGMCEVLNSEGILFPSVPLPIQEAALAAFPLRITLQTSWRTAVRRGMVRYLHPFGACRNVSPYFPCFLLGNTTGMEVYIPRNGHGIWEIMTNSEIRTFSTRPYMVSASRTQLLVAVMVGTEGPYWDPTWMIISYYFSLGSTEEGRVNVGFFLVRSWGCRLKL